MHTTEQFDYRAQTASIDTVPKDLDSPDSKLLYLYLHTEGKAHIDEIQATLDMKKLALYPVLNTLVSANLVERHGETFQISG